MKSILLVDDEKIMVKSLAFLLTRNGYRVASAGSKQEAVDILENETFDLIILDLKLSGDNGLDLLPLFCKHCPDTKVLILTGHITLDAALKAFQSGARDYLVKPVEPGKLLERVRIILDDEPGSDSQSKVDAEFVEFIRQLRKEEGSGHDD